MWFVNYFSLGINANSVLASSKNRTRRCTVEKRSLGVGFLSDRQNQAHLEPMLCCSQPQGFHLLPEAKPCQGAAARSPSGHQKKP